MEGTTAAAVAAAASALITGVLTAQLLPLLHGAAAHGEVPHPMLPPLLRLYLATVRYINREQGLSEFKLYSCLIQKIYVCICSDTNLV